ncbi:MFS transporter [Rhodococcus sp. G-MC3]|uniref:MFS transporter n=1 Tax=Rhodococcus sp. G-MC3 TaxID=3046209 RepID=UPI0024B89E73|nr:MFS transporter [Rhodococcus sp. G-MC3]MDJ0396649.1 MFS transporter [Rhodococcus sp. G-MC3]
MPDILTSAAQVGAHHRIQQRTVGVLAAGQVLGGLGMGAAVSMGALLVTDVTGSASWSGMAATSNTLGAALFAIPLALLARRRGRRVSMASGAVIAAVGALGVAGWAAAGNAVLVLASLIVMGAGTALGFQARFAATDLATKERQGRDLSLVVWATTIGAVVGPNLAEPGEALGHALRLPEFTGGFVIAGVAQLLGAALYFASLRPDPLLLAIEAAPAPAHNETTSERPSGGFAILRRNSGARRAVITIALSHAVMVALMGMTPVHLTSHGASLTVVGVTISLHVAGMYGFSPLFGILADRAGGHVAVLVGQALLATALLVAAFGANDAVTVTASLILLGLGWSATTVAGSAMLSAALPVEQRAPVQGVSDFVMNIVGAAGGALAGPILTGIGFGGLATSLLLLVVSVSALQIRAVRSDSKPTKAPTPPRELPRARYARYAREV